MRSISWILAAGSVALSFACSSTPTTEAPSDAHVEGTRSELGKAHIVDVLSDNLARNHAHRGAQRLATGQYVTPARCPARSSSF